MSRLLYIHEMREKQTGKFLKQSYANVDLSASSEERQRKQSYTQNEDGDRIQDSKFYFVVDLFSDVAGKTRGHEGQMNKAFSFWVG